MTAMNTFIFQLDLVAFYGCQILKRFLELFSDDKSNLFNRYLVISSNYRQLSADSKIKNVSFIPV